MSAIDSVFAELRRTGRKAFVPFVTAGDPDLDFTRQVVGELSRRGASICELGIPYSDPIADGPVIQASYTRALDNGVSVESILSAAKQISAEHPTPLVTMVSYAIIHRRGLSEYVAQAQAAGIAGAIVPDLLVEEAEEFAKICAAADFSLIQLVTPTTDRDRAQRIAQLSTGFLYYVSVTGITGERQELPPQLLEDVAWLRERCEVPVCIGFGISGPEQARSLGAVADGVIVGSAIVRRIANGGATPVETIADVGKFADEILAALNESK